MNFSTLLSPLVARSGDKKRTSSLRSSTKQRCIKKQGRKVRFRKPTIHKVESYAHYDLWDDTKQYSKARDATFVRYSEVARAYFVMYDEAKDSLVLNKFVTPQATAFIKAGIKCDYRGIERLRNKKNQRDIFKAIVRFQLFAATVQELADFACFLTAPDACFARYLAKMDAAVVKEELHQPQSTGLFRKKRANLTSPGDKPLPNSKFLTKPSYRVIKQYFVKSSPPKSFAPVQP